MDSNRTQQLRTDLVDLPTLDEHAREARRIFTTCIASGAIVVVTALTAIVGALILGVAPQTVAVFAMLTMNVCVVAFGLSYGIPVGLISLRRLELTIRMSRIGLDRSCETADAITGLVRKVDPIVQVLDRQTQDGYLEKIEGHLKTIADRVRRDTAPLSVVKRQTTEA